MKQESRENNGISSPPVWSGAYVESLLSRFSKSRVLAVGDVMLDRYIWGRVSRISPEAPVQVLDVTQETETLGGAANVAHNLATFTPHISFGGVLGQDAAGDRVAAMLQRLGIDIRGLLRDKHRTTTQKTRIIAENQQVLRIDREVCTPISSELEERVCRFVEDTADHYDGFLLSDYGKGVLTDSVIRRLIDLARARSKPIIVDPKGTRYRRYADATLLTPNRKEASLAAGVEITDRPSLVEAARRIQEQVGDTQVLVTMGAQGMALFGKDGTFTPIPTAAREVYDVSGAGDTAVALLGLGLCSGLSLEHAAVLANAAAGIVVGKVGTAVVTPGELVEAFSLSEGPLSRKTRTVEALARLVAKLKAEGKTVVFTNGCFDLLHAGHVRLLEASKRLGDVLVVAVDDDDSIRRLKGEGRPILKRDERLRILAALDSVDFLCVFSSPNLDAILETLKPDILTKGSNYAAEEILGREVVERNGGRVVPIPVVEAESVSSLIQRIRENGPAC